MSTTALLAPVFFPDLTQILQPLSGEYAGFREVFEKIPFPIGYGIETSMILDICEKWGMDVIAQVDLEKRVHRNQDTKALGKMAFVILDTFFRRIEKQQIVALNKALHKEMIQYKLVKNEILPDVFKIAGVERPPMIEIPEYRHKFYSVSDAVSADPKATSRQLNCTSGSTLKMVANKSEATRTDATRSRPPKAISYQGNQP